MYVTFAISWGLYVVGVFKRLLKKGFKVKLSSFKKLIELCVIFALSLIASFNYYNSDYSMYERIYNSSSAPFVDSSTDIGFYVLCKIGNFLGLDYQAVVAVVVCFCLFGYYRYIKRNCDSRLYVIVVYLLASYALDVIQIRQFIATAIYLNIVHYLFSKNSKGDLIKYIIGTVIAGCFHSSLFVCLLFLVLKVKKEKRIRVAVAIAAVIVLGIIVMQRTGYLTVFFSNFMEEDQISAYLSSSSRYHNTVRTVIMYIITQPVLKTALLLVAFKFFYNKSETTYSDQIYINTVIGMSIVLLCLCPVYFFSLQFRRIERIIFLPTVIGYIKMIESYGSHGSRRKYNKYILYIIMLIFALVSLWWNLNGNEDLISNFFAYNYLF